MTSSSSSEATSPACPTFMVRPPREAVYGPGPRDTHLLPLVEAPLVAVGDVDAAGAQHVQELQVVQRVLHLAATGPLARGTVGTAVTRAPQPEPGGAAVPLAQLQPE